VAYASSRPHNATAVKNTACWTNGKPVYEAARQRHPERWSQGTTRNWEPVAAVWLNPD